MIVYGLSIILYEFLILLISLIPSFEGITNVFSFLPSMFERIVTFNYYLPVAEAVTVVVTCLGITLNFKAIKIILNKFGIDLTK